MIDLHNHTVLCGHATGSPEEYINEAKKKGITIFGFSDHAPLPDHLYKDITMHSSQTEEYITTVEKLKKVYKEEIEIKLGFEVDYPFRDSFKSDYFTDDRIDYIIGSVHFIGDAPIDYEEDTSIYTKIGIDGVYEDYYELIIELISSGKVDIIGHLDLVKKLGYKPAKPMDKYITKIASLAAKNGTAIEINTAGLRKPAKEMYPSIDILKVLLNTHVPITLGSDSHSPQEVGANIKDAIAMLKDLGGTTVSVFSQRKRFELKL